MTNTLKFESAPKTKMLCARLAFLGLGGICFGFFFTPARTWLNLLVDGFYFLSLAVSAVFFLATQRLSGARWSRSLERVPEAFMSAMPAGALLMLVVVFGWRWIYPWSQPGALLSELPAAGKVEYLRSPFVFGRMVLILLSWVTLAWLMRRTLRRSDRASSLADERLLNRYSALFVVVFAVTFTGAAYDWLISLEPSWFSTIYGIYVFAGCFLQGLAAVTLGVVLLKERCGSGEFAKEQQLYNLGQLLFAFSTFWAYIWVSQYLLIWYGNLPDEVTHYVRRTHGGWLYLFLGNVVVNWVIPFVLLLPKSAKSNLRNLKLASILLLFGHWLDLYLLIMPSAQAVPRLGAVELFTAFGYAGLFIYIVLRSLANAPLIPSTASFEQEECFVYLDGDLIEQDSLGVER